MKKIKLLVITLLILLSPSVFASGNAIGIGPGGNAGEWESGNAYLTYNTDNMGMRFALYSYNGSKLINLATKDLSQTSTNRMNRTILRTTGMKAKLNYTQLGESIAYTSATPSGSPFTSTDSILNQGNLYKITNSKLEVTGNIKDKILRRFKLTGSDAEINAALNSFFGTSNVTRGTPIADLYLTVEPTIAVYMSRCVSFSTSICDPEKYRYGTIYELIQTMYPMFSIGTYRFKLLGLDLFPNLIFAKLNQENNDKYNLVQPVSGGNGTHLLNNVSAPIGNYVGGNNIKNDPKSGFGIGVFWLAAERKSCESTCSGSGDELLKCAESYCQDNFKADKTSKKACILDCGYKKTYEDKKLNCPSTTSTKGSDTVCKAETSSAKKNCRVVEGANYRYLVDCGTTTKVVYPDLGKTINPGKSISYEVDVSGNKTCHFIFDYEYWKAQYAYAETEARRAELVNALNTFTNTKWSSESYNSKNVSINLEVKEKLIGNKELKNVVTLKPEADYNYGSAAIKIVNRPKKEVYSFKNGNKVSYSVNEAQTKSENGVTFKLPLKCLDGKNPGKILDPINSTTCPKSSFSPLNRYYTNINALENNKNYSVTRVLDSNDSGLLVKNDCDYFTTDLSCKLVSLTNSNPNGLYKAGQNLNLELTIDGDRSLIKEISASPNLINNDPNNSLKYSYKIPSTSSSLQAIDIKLITVNGTTISCPAEVELDPPCPGCRCELTESSSGNNVTLSIKANAYTASAKYYISLNGPIDPNNDKAYLHERKTVTFDRGKGIYNAYAYVVDQGVIHFGSDCIVKYPKEGQGQGQGQSCRTACAPKDTSCIKNYCAANPTDGGRYNDEADCLRFCSSNCGHFRCEQVNEIKNYCRTSYEAAGYSSEGVCVNDCSCYGKNYFYRPIDLLNPFPNREAGSNWFGLESIIEKTPNPETKNRTDGAVYVIELDGNRIKEIRQQTKAYNTSVNNAYLDYVRSSSVNSLEYKSKFIHDTDRAAGGFRDFFTIIDGK